MILNPSPNPQYGAEKIAVGIKEGFWVGVDIATSIARENKKTRSLDNPSLRAKPKPLFQLMAIEQTTRQKDQLKEWR